MKLDRLIPLVLLTFVTVLGTAAAEPAPPGPAILTVQVDCSSEDRLERALAQPAQELVVELSGTCVGDLLIQRDRVTLRGVTPDATLAGDASNPAPAVTIRGSQVVRLEDLSIQGDLFGVRLHQGASATFSGVELSGSQIIGVLIEENSSLVASNFSATGVGVFGTAVFDSSSLTVERSVDLSFNGVVGLLMSTGASLHPRGAASFTANDNGVVGVALQSGAHALFPDFEARRNGLSGVDLVFEGSFASIGEVNISDNGLFGVVAADRSVFCAAGRLDGNGSAAIFASENATIAMATGEPSAITGSPVVLANVTGSFSNISIDGTVDLSFGSRTTFGPNTTVGAISCDGTVLTQGALSCPSSLSELESESDLPSLDVQAARTALERAIAELSLRRPYVRPDDPAIGSSAP